ncbi:hypothetical protein FANTH_8870 [Fusarium anthophilum]|uniref:Uncharacterized protein n=1 Tax=Fusarium anthophilum TaxID=48485 RepID=A0A8H4Z9P5_9HYPO|nr:hypothetical protein FANTH_8870 [Fusarium anthophilum]
MDDLNCNGLNATECLLRVTASILEQLKDDSSAFNWDPASFVVTLVIGIIAAAFAFFAIIQGFLAAGPGRHKCSKYAIGTWASLSKRKFDWSELRYRSTAQTPVIKVGDLLVKMEILENDGHFVFQWRENGSRTRNLDPNLGPFERIVVIATDHPWEEDQLFPKLQYVRKEVSDYFPATWLRLLTYTGLHHPELWHTNPQGTDYLPSDLAAAPAYSTVADLISVASIAAGRIRFNSVGQGTLSEASIQGDCIDINFRSHPLLGVYGAIDQGRPDPRQNDILESHEMSTYTRPSAHKLFIKLAYSRGFLFSVQHLHVDLEPSATWSMTGPLSAHDRRNFSGALINSIYESTCDCGTTGAAQEDAARNHREVMFEWCQSRTSTGTYGYTWATDCFDLGEGDISILAAAIPVTGINLFPKKLAKIGDKFIFLVILSRYCMKADVSTRGHMVDGGIPVANTAPGVERQNLQTFKADWDLWKRSRLFTTCLGGLKQARANGGPDYGYAYVGHETREIQVELGRIDSWIIENQQQRLMVCRIMALAFTTAVCKQMYQGNHRVRRWPIKCDITRKERRKLDETINGQGEIIPNSLSAITSLISLQVRKLREYQNRQDGPLSVDQYFTNSCKKPDGSSESAPENKPFRFLEYMEHITKLWEKDGDGFKYPTAQVQHYLDNLLVYRATLIYMLISQAADNSHILTNLEYYKLIPVI